MKNYDEKTVLNHLIHKCGVRLNVTQTSIQLIVPRTAGIHTWGKIDYLVNYCGYVAIIPAEEEEKA